MKQRKQAPHHSIVRHSVAKGLEEYGIILRQAQFSERFGREIHHRRP